MDITSGLRSHQCDVPLSCESHGIAAQVSQFDLYTRSYVKLTRQTAISSSSASSSSASNDAGFALDRWLNAHKKVALAKCCSDSDSAVALEQEHPDEDLSARHFVAQETVVSALQEDFNHLIYNMICVLLEDPKLLSKSQIPIIVGLIKPYYDLDMITLNPQPTQCDRFGFYLSRCEPSEVLMQQILGEILDNRAMRAWTIQSHENLKQLIRQFGIPHSLRPKLWLGFIQNEISNAYNIDNLLQLAEETNQQQTDDSSDECSIRQIDLDLFRTMPNNQMFSHNSQGLAKLRRILIAYSIHVNPNIGYCQAMNFLAALLLIIFEGNERHALMGLICIIDHYLPPNYFDEFLTGVRADQMLLRDLILEQILDPLSESDRPDKKELQDLKYKLDEITGSVTLNWFLSLFHNVVPWQTRLYIVDCFWLEGIKVLFRFSLAELCVDQQLFERLRNCEHAKIGELINEIKFNCNRDHDLLRLTERAFRRTRMPSRKQLVTRRNLYSNQLIAARHARNARHHDNSSGSDESFGQNSITSAGGDSKHIEPNIIYNASLPTTPTSIDGSSHRDRSSSRSPISISPATPPGWLRKSVQDLFRLSTPQSVQSNGSTNTIEGDITRKSGALVVSSNHSKIALLQSYGDHSRIDVRDIRYCSIFYPNRRPSIVLSDSEQHAASVCRLDARFDARLWLVGVSSDAHHVLLCEPEAGNYACTTFLDKGVRVWLFEVPGRLQFAFFNARDWTLLTVDPMGRVSKMPLKAAEQPPDHVQQSEPFLIGNNCSSNDDDGGGGDQLLMASLDPDYRLLWLYCTAEVKMNDINPEIAEDNSQIKKNNEKLASLSLATVALQTSATERFGRLWMRRLVRLARKSGSIEEEERRDVNNDQSINRPDHERRKSSGIELSGSDLDDESSVSSNPGVEVKSTNLDNLHPNYSSSTESGSDSDTSIDWQILQTDSDYSINRHFTQTDGEPVVKTSTTTNPVTVRRIQRVLVLDTVNLRVFRELRLNGTVQITHLVTAGGMAYCAHADGSVSMMSSGSDGVGSSMLNSRKSLLQAQPDEKLIHLQVFDVSCPASLKSLVGEQLAECLKRKHSDSQRSTASSGSADLSVIGDADEMHSDRDMVAPEEPIDSTSRTESLEESTEMIPPLPARLSHVRNSDILVVALYRSGKLHCIYTKNGCVQERKMTRLDVSGPEGLQIERLNIVSALKMDWKEEEEAVVNNALSCRSSSLDMNASGPNEPDETDHQTEGRLKPRSASILKRSASHKLESELDTGRSIVRRCSLSPNQCSYLVTLCSPTPNYRLINVKL